MRLIDDPSKIPTAQWDILAPGITLHGPSLNDHPDKFKIVDTSYGRALELVSWDPELAIPLKLPQVNLFAKSSIEAEKRACGVVREVLGMMVEKRTLIDHLTHFRKEFGLPNKLRAMIVRHSCSIFENLFDSDDSNLDYDFHDDDNESTQLYANGGNGEFWTAYGVLAFYKKSGDEGVDSEPWRSIDLVHLRPSIGNKDNICSFQTDNSSLNLLSDKNGSLAETECSKGKVEMSNYNLVTCPVCGNKVSGEVYTINSHLDGCLCRRTKRKLTQLLQLNFGCSQSKVQISSGESEQLLTSDVDKSSCDSEENATCSFSKNSPSEEKSHDQRRELPHIESVKQIDMAGSTENPISDGRENIMVEFPALSTDNMEPRHRMDETVDIISGMYIDTFIVGRRFRDEKDVNLGETISLLRDPDNIKDSNAIKGFLQGYVISVPRHSLDAVPIQIVCQNMIFDGRKECDDFEVFKHLWQKALQVVEFAKNSPPNTTKYQQNFCLLLQEVLTSSPHLFTKDEYKIIGAEAFLPKWRTGSVSIPTGGSGDCQVSYLQLHNFRTDFSQAIEVAQIMDQSLDENNFELVLRCIMRAESRISSSPEKLIDSKTPELMATFLSCLSSSWVYSKAMLLGISFLEREHRFIFKGDPLNCEAGRKSRFYGEDGEQCGLEQLALQYYATEGGGWLGVHTESGIWLTIFGLLMWDILFSVVPNVFSHQISAPLDMETDHFYLARMSLVESHLQKILDGLAEEILITSWELHMGTACRGVNWDRHSLSDLRAAVSCIGGPCLASLQTSCSGLPEFVRWNARFVALALPRRLQG
ncbi:hypothetical protein CRYUN_Cryun40dG0071600 [Craigia yunnanensis]